MQNHGRSFGARESTGGPDRQENDVEPTSGSPLDGTNCCDVLYQTFAHYEMKAPEGRHDLSDRCRRLSDGAFAFALGFDRMAFVGDPSRFHAFFRNATDFERVSAGPLSDCEALFGLYVHGTPERRHPTWIPMIEDLSPSVADLLIRLPQKLEGWGFRDCTFWSLVLALLLHHRHPETCPGALHERNTEQAPERLVRARSVPTFETIYELLILQLPPSEAGWSAPYRFAWMSLMYEATHLAVEMREAGAWPAGQSRPIAT